MQREEDYLPTSNEFFQLLKQSGQFDDLEIKVVFAFLTLENKHRDPVLQLQFTAAQISKESDMSVTNAYKYLYSLQRKGVVESREDKNKVFWLTRSSNPFPRIFSNATKDYLAKKDLFVRLQSIYEKFVRTGESIWFGLKVYEEYEGEFVNRAAFILDAAKDEALITTQKFYEDVVLLDAIKRAIERGVKIRVITQEIHAENIDKFHKIGIDMRLGRAYPYVVIVDGVHGITEEGDKGTWFLNCPTHFKEKFEELWDKAEIL